MWKRLSAQGHGQAERQVHVPRPRHKWMGLSGERRGRKASASDLLRVGHRSRRACRAARGRSDVFPGDHRWRLASASDWRTEVCLACAAGGVPAGPSGRSTMYQAETGRALLSGRQSHPDATRWAIARAGMVKNADGVDRHPDPARSACRAPCRKLATRACGRNPPVVARLLAA